MGISLNFKPIFFNSAKITIMPESTAKDKSPRTFREPRLLEMSNLVKRYPPLTINGVPTSSLKVPISKHLSTLCRSKEVENIYLSFLVKPSDPEFPFDIEFVNVSLCVPRGYPFKKGKPSLTVLNDDISRGYSVNIEIGFSAIVVQAMDQRQRTKGKGGNKKKENESDSPIKLVRGTDLSSMVMTMDKYLEEFLSQEKKDTIKFVRAISSKKQEAMLESEKVNKQREDATAEEPTRKEAVRTVSKRDEELKRFVSRFQNSSVRIYKETPYNTIYCLELEFERDTLVLEIEGLEEFNITQLPIKLIVPKEYLANAKKPLKLEVDMNNQSNLAMINAIEEKNLRLILGKMLSNMGQNFAHVAADCSKENVSFLTGEEKNFHTITSQVNFFVFNIEKFLRDPAEFVKWDNLRKEANEQ